MRKVLNKNPQIRMTKKIIKPKILLKKQLKFLIELKVE